MGTSNLDRLIMSLPESDIDHLKLHNIQDHQCNSSSSLTTPNALENGTQDNQEDTSSSSGGLKVQVPYPTGEFKVSNDDDNPKTPTATEHRIPVMTTCPLAPRKAKRVPATGKRKAPFFAGVITPENFLIYVDAMLALNEAVYVPDIVVGDLGAGDRAKRLKPVTSPAHEP
ncbi:unnamed protein product [Lactuca virosa]|uniref:Uncharacterized protein n=1 Tax=Lactuca virosa TaxID=75947 RepID=A0AAU9N3Z3_9ASTR|nr:unnamed protein product [Lactuca virosa]